MPNWCTNKLVLLNDKEGDIITALKPFMVVGEDNRTYFSLDKLKPMPDGVDPHEWRNENWGTKWDLDKPELTGDALHFQSAWTPPIEALKTLAASTGKTFRLYYSEMGVGFAGIATIYPNGEVEDDELTADAVELIRELELYC